MRAVNIKWDADKDVLGQLPEEMQIPAGVKVENIEDWMSEQTGWCVFGFRLVPDARIKEARIPCPPVMLEYVTWRMFYLESPADLADVCMVLYEEARTYEIERMEGASYPCWALFTVDEEKCGRCEGAWSGCMAELSGWASAIASATGIPDPAASAKDVFMGKAVHAALPGIVLNDKGCSTARKEYEALLSRNLCATPDEKDAFMGTAVEAALPGMKLGKDGCRAAREEYERLVSGNAL